MVSRRYQGGNVNAKQKKLRSSPFVFSSLKQTAAERVCRMSVAHGLLSFTSHWLICTLRICLITFWNCLYSWHRILWKLKSLQMYNALYMKDIFVCLKSAAWSKVPVMNETEWCKRPSSYFPCSFSCADCHYVHCLPMEGKKQFCCWYCRHWLEER